MIDRTHYTIQLHKDNLPVSSARIAFLTDLHCDREDERTDEIFRILCEEEPDLILAGGDMYVGRTGHRPDAAGTFVQRLKTISPVICGMGNHELRTRLYPEQYPGVFARYAEMLSEAGISLLENASLPLALNGLTLRIYGYDMEAPHYDRWHRHMLDIRLLRDCFGMPDPHEISILLAHNPLMTETYLQWGTDLTLCGHYHGGIMRLGGNRGLISPDLRPFSQYAYGEYRKEDRRVIISAGCGEHTIPLRLHNPREIVFLNLQNRS